MPSSRIPVPDSTPTSRDSVTCGGYTDDRVVHALGLAPPRLGQHNVKREIVMWARVLVKSRHVRVPPV